MTEYIAGSLIILGSIFTLLAAIGIVKFPDTFMRMSATTKAATFGVGLLLLGSAIYFGSLLVVTKAVIIIIFVTATAPISAHMLAKAAFFSNTPLWKESIMNDLKDKYDPHTNQFKSNYKKDLNENI